mmetsp:Transcript_14058/g.40078  ORF Transcript_14058/g.40078 Transcript_14058/m.40078 type:complete len:320 (+) Transcript_14058:327-1286(+)
MQLDSTQLNTTPGFCNVFVGHPLDLMKVRQQTAPSPSSAARAAIAQSVNKTGGMAMARVGGNGAINMTAATAAAAEESTLGMLRGVFVKEGFRGLYRGVSAPLVAVTPAFAVNFWSFDMASRGLRKVYNQSPTSQLSISQTALAGGFSGVALATIIGPSERIKCLMQVDKQKYSGFVDCARQVYAEGGLRSIFRGTGGAILRDVPGNAAYFGSYELLKRAAIQIEGNDKPSTAAILLAGGFAGVANWVVAIPMDTVKTRWQTAPAGTYKNLPDVVRTLIRTEGVPALFRGLSASLMRAFPANAACLCGVETVKGMIEER